MEITFSILLGIICSFVYRTWGWLPSLSIIAALGLLWFSLWCFTWVMHRRTAIMISKLPLEERRAFLNELEEDQLEEIEKHINKIEQIK